MTSRSTQIRLGLQDSWTVGLGMVPLGLAFGLLVTQMGFAWWWAPIMSVLIYAGSMEFLVLGMITGGTSALSSLVAGFLVNFRHIFYGLTYPRHRVASTMGRAYVTYSLTDEVYAITSVFGPHGTDSDGKPVSGTRLLTISLFCQAAWVLSGVVGGLGGSVVQLELQGLDFALTALFVVLALDAFQTNRDFSLPLIAAGLGLVATWLFPGQILMVALIAYFVVLLTRFYSLPLDSALTWRTPGDRARRTVEETDGAA